jgi:hypothetical protein
MANLDTVTTTLRTYVPVSLLTTLRSRAALAGVSVSELVREVLQGWLAERPTGGRG